MKTVPAEAVEYSRIFDSGIEATVWGWLAALEAYLVGLPVIYRNLCLKVEGEGMHERRVGLARSQWPGDRYLYLSCLIIVGQVGALLLLDRQWLCTCGSVRLWQGVLDPDQNSQQLTDHYSLLAAKIGNDYINKYIALELSKDRRAMPPKLLGYDPDTQPSHAPADESRCRRGGSSRSSRQIWLPHPAGRRGGLRVS